MSKYDSLWKYLQKDDSAVVVVTFEKVKNILGFQIDHSFLRYKKESEAYGYAVHTISLKEKKIEFVKLV